MQQNYTKHNKTLQNTTKLYKKAPKLYKTQQNYKLHPNYTKHNKTIQNTMKLYKTQQN